MAAKQMMRHCAVTLLLLLLPTLLLALDPTTPLIQYSHAMWTINDGLPENLILDILQARDGYLYMATSNGLVRFDGYAFKVFDISNTEGMKSDCFYGLLEARDGSLWMETAQNSLVQMKDGRFTTYTMEKGFVIHSLVPMLESEDGSIWIGALNGLYRFHQGIFKRYSKDDGLLSATIKDLQKDAKGNLWIVSEKGLNIYKDGQIQSFSSSDGLASNDVNQIFLDHDSNMLIGTEKGLFVFKDGGFDRVSLGQERDEGVLLIHEDESHDLWIFAKHGIHKIQDGRYGGQCMPLNWQNMLIRDTITGKDGCLWIATGAGDLLRFNKGRLEKYSENKALATELVFSMYRDREGMIWIGERNGLHRMKESSIQEHIVSAGIVFVLCEGGSGEIYLGTLNGVMVLKEGIYPLLNRKGGLPSNIVGALCKAESGGVWVGTTDGMILEKGGYIEDRGVKERLRGKTIAAICEDSKGGLWAGTWGDGVIHINKGDDGGSMNEYVMSGSDVVCIMEDSNGNMWFATDDGIYRSPSAGQYVAMKEMKGKSIACLYEDSEGVVWIGTNGNGLVRYKSGKLSKIGEKDGLFNKSVYWILEDDHGNLWMTCNRGIYRVSRKDLNDLCDGKRSSIECVSYDESDGMTSAECNGGTSPAGWKARDGKLWFPTIKGVVCLDPNNLPYNPLPPPVVVEEVTVDGKTADFKDAPRFQPGKGDLVVKYTALSFVNPKKVKFKYRLEGYDTDWVDAGTRRTAYYTNIPSGEHTFRVIACNNDGVWNLEGASFAFYMQPHWYQTVLFYVFAIALALGLAVLITRIIIRIRLRVVQAEAGVLEERNRMAREIHDTLAQGLSGILMQLQAVKITMAEKPDQASEHLQKASDMAQMNLEEASRSVWALRPKLLEDADLERAVREMVYPMVADPSLELQIHVKGKVRPLHPELEINALRIIQEAVANAVRHAQATIIEVTMAYEGRRIRLTVKDDGIGIDPAAAEKKERRGYGLTSMRQRAEQMKGSMTVNGRPGEGTEVVAVLPYS